MSARLEFYYATEKVYSINLTRKALEAIRGVSIARRGPDSEEELFDLRHNLSFPVTLAVERLDYALTLGQPGGSEVEKRLNVPLLRYQQKTKLIFPIKGKCWVGLGHDFNEPHSDGRGQHFAYDIQGPARTGRSLGIKVLQSRTSTPGRAPFYRQRMERFCTRAMMYRIIRSQAAFRQSCMQNCRNGIWQFLATTSCSIMATESAVHWDICGRGPCV